MKLFVKTKLIDLTTSKFKSLADFEKVYGGTLLPLPYVSSSKDDVPMTSCSSPASFYD